jgi:hypothetical protein
LCPLNKSDLIDVSLCKDPVAGTASVWFGNQFPLLIITNRFFVDPRPVGYFPDFKRGDALILLVHVFSHMKKNIINKLGMAPRKDVTPVKFLINLFHRFPTATSRVLHSRAVAGCSFGNRDFASATVIGTPVNFSFFKWHNNIFCLL